MDGNCCPCPVVLLTAGMGGTCSTCPVVSAVFGICAMSSPCSFSSAMSAGDELSVRMRCAAIPVVNCCVCISLLGLLDSLLEPLLAVISVLLGNCSCLDMRVCSVNRTEEGIEPSAGLG